MSFLAKHICHRRWRNNFCNIMMSFVMQYKNTTSSQAPRCASWKAYKLTNKQADKLTGRKYEEIKRRQDDKMTWWHGDTVPSKVKVAKISKSCQGLQKKWLTLANIAKRWRKSQKIHKSSPKFMRAAKSCQKYTKICPEKLKFANSCQK